MDGIGSTEALPPSAHDLVSGSAVEQSSNTSSFISDYRFVPTTTFVDRLMYYAPYAIDYRSSLEATGEIFALTNLIAYSGKGLTATMTTIFQTKHAEMTDERSGEDQTRCFKLETTITCVFRYQRHSSARHGHSKGLRPPPRQA